MRLSILCLLFICTAAAAYAEFADGVYTDTLGRHYTIADKPATVFALLQCDILIYDRIAQEPGQELHVQTYQQTIADQDQPPAETSFGRKYGASGVALFKQQVEQMSHNVKVDAARKHIDQPQDFTAFCQKRARDLGRQYGE